MPPLRGLAVMLNKLVVLTTAVFLLMCGCENKQQNDEFKFIEWLKISGTCYEDHVRQPSQYEGSLVHWFNVTKQQDDVYGSVHSPESTTVQNMVNRLENPYKYSPPFAIEFWQVPPVLLEEKIMMLKGVSRQLGAHEHEDSAKYESTCEVTVLERRDHLPKDEG